jgi:hypothetical protein
MTIATAAMMMMMMTTTTTTAARTTVTTTATMTTTTVAAGMTTRRAIGIACGLLSLAACSNDDTTTLVPPSVAPTSSVAGARTTASTAPPDAAAPTAPIDGATSLQQAVTALGPNYHFSTVVTVNDQPVLAAEGDRVGEGARLMITSNGASVAYIVTPQGSWVLPEEGDWEALETPPATADPLIALAAATTVSVLSANGTQLDLLATVPAVALGLPDGPESEVRVTLDGGALRTVRYDTVAGGSPASVVATISAVLDATPVAPPG